MVLTLILVISIFLQSIAAFLILKLIRVTGWRLCWILIASAILLMAIRRLVTLFYSILHNCPYTANLPAELVAVVTSALFLIGIITLFPIFASFKKSEQELAVRNKIATIFLSISDEQMYGEVLKIILNVLKSKYGIFGYIDEYGNWVCPSLTTDVWDKCKMIDKGISFPREKFGGIWGEAITKKKVIFSNRMLNVPKGHIIINRALDVPIIYQGNVIGNIIVGNKESDYNDQDIKLLKTIADYIAPILQARLEKDKEEKSRKQAVEALTQNKQFLEAIFNSSIDSIITLDLDRRITSCNPSFLKQFGYTREEVIGKSVSIIHPSEESFTSYGKNIYPIINKKGFYRREWKYRRKDGTLIPTEGVVSTMKKADGEIIGYVAVMRDISERKKTEKRLKESEKRFRDIAESMFDWIWEVDKRSIYTYCSDRVKNILGYTPKEMIGKTPFDFMPSDESKRIKPIFAEIVKGKKPIVNLENWNFTKDGRLVCLLTNAIPIFDEQGEFLGYRGVDKDITERKKAEEEKEIMQAQLMQAQKMEAIGTLAAGMAHDFNNLLTAIQGYSEMMIMKSDKKNSFYQNLKNIYDASLQGAALIRQLLLFSRKQQVEFVLLDINKTVERLLKMLKRIIGEDIVIKTELDPDLYSVRADAGNIEQVIMNLIVNARDAMPKGGVITIKSENVILDKKQSKYTPKVKAGEYVCLSISDTGVGMDKNTINHIFEPFFTTKSREKGTGLGLSVVYGIIKQHEGWINVYSEPNQGTIFKVYLPAISEKPKEETKKEISYNQLTGKGERILLVEDEDAVRAFAKDVLEDNNYVVFEAETAKKALEIFDKEKGDFHLVFSDMVLPDLDGLELVEKFLSKNPDLTILLTSGYTDDKSKWPAIQEKNLRFMQKPYGLTKLLKSVKDVLEGNKT